MYSTISYNMANLSILLYNIATVHLGCDFAITVVNYMLINSSWFWWVISCSLSLLQRSIPTPVILTISFSTSSYVVK